MELLTYEAGLRLEEEACEYIIGNQLDLNPEVVQCTTKALFAEMVAGITAYDMTDPYRTTLWKLVKCQPNDLMKIILLSPIDMANDVKELESYVPC